jgi:N-6 DNA Methylase
MARRSTDSLIFDTLRLEGGLFVPAVLEKAARGEHTAQKAADYRLPKGLSLVDEQGRAFRIASALQKTFEPTRGRTDVDATRATLGFVTELLREALGYSDLTLCSKPVTLADRAYPVTALAAGGRVPVIIAPHTLDLDQPDERFAVLGSGSRRRSAYQLAQQFLNASHGCTWAILTNGRQLRLVRDADTLTRPAFLEADLDLILRAQRYPDFAAVWRLFHASRAGAPDAAGDTTPWESWKKEGQEQGQRVREGLRTGVTDALLAIGTGFIEHPANEALRSRLQSGDLTVNDYLQQLFRLIYRFLFLFTVEERGLLHVADESPEARRAREAYAQGYAFRRLRDRALRRSGFDRYSDIWTSVRIVFAGLAGGQPRLALPALGGLFATTQCPDLDGAGLDNRVLLTAMRHLRWSASSGQLAAIDYRNMDTEELGSVYESLLELVPTLDLPARRFGFVGLTDAGSTAGNARKTSGSYYTPDSLVQELIKSALDPVIAKKVADHPADPIEALLSLAVCDPSSGSGHFLLAAARRIAEKLAELRAVDGAVTPADYRHALREVASRCIYGVDINPMAVELCRVALWLETIDPGKPLGFLNHHIRTGNSLLGTTPDLIAAGLPDETFTAIEGDDKAACTELKKRNKNEREGFGPLFQQEEQTIRDRLRLAATQLEAMDDNQPTARDQKEAAFTTSETAPEYRHAKLLADLWCAAFVIKKHYPGASTEAPVSTPPAQVAPVEGQLLHSQDELFGLSAAASAPKVTSKKQPKPKNPEQGTPVGITTGTLRDFVQGKPLPADLQPEVEGLGRQYRFFHWHLAFPQVFNNGGFDCMLGNPPWERVKLQEKEWFAERCPEIAKAPTASSRKSLINSLRASDPRLHARFENAARQAEGESHFMRNSGGYPLCGRGDLNLYAVFAERIRILLNPNGYLGCVLPTGIATDDTTKFFIRDVLERRSLISLYDFENKNIFPDVHSSYKFCLLTSGSTHGGTANTAQFVFFAHTVEDLKDDVRRFSLGADEIAILNPNSRTCPVFRTKHDSTICLAVVPRTLCLYEELTGRTAVDRFSLTTLFHLTMDRDVIFPSEEMPASGYALMHEGKAGHQFNHRFATWDGSDFNSTNLDKLADPIFSNALQLCGPLAIATERYARRKPKCQSGILSYRRVARNTDERTMIAAILPFGPTSYSWINVAGPDAVDTLFLCGVFNSFIFDYLLRNLLSQPSIPQGLVEQIRVPIFTPNSDWLIKFSNKIVLELTYTAWDLGAFAADCGWNGPPFRWDEERRFLLRCELDAAFFHLYLGPLSEWQKQPEALTRAFPTPRHAVGYIMDTFPIVKRKDEAKHGGIYRTKETILQIYDALQDSIRTGQPYQTLLDPPPADPRCCHPPKPLNVRTQP